MYDFTHFVDVFSNVSHELVIRKLDPRRQGRLSGLHASPALIWTPTASALSNATFCIRARLRRTTVALLTVTNLIEMKSSYSRLCH